MLMHPLRAEFGDDAFLDDVVFDEDRHYSNDEIMTVALEQLSGKKLEALLNLQIDIFISPKQTHAIRCDAAIKDITMDYEKVVDTFLDYIRSDINTGPPKIQNMHLVKDKIIAVCEPDENNKVLVYTLATHCGGVVNRHKHDVSNSATGDPVADAFQQRLEEFYTEEVFLDLKNKRHRDLTGETQVLLKKHVRKGDAGFKNPLVPK